VIEETAENVQLQEQTGQDANIDQPVNSEGTQDNQNLQTNASEDSETRNFVEMRKKNEELQRRNDEAMQIIRNIEAQKQQERQQQEQPKPRQELEFELQLGDDDDLVDVKTVKTILANQKELAKSLRESNQKNVQMTSEARLKAQYPDLNKVVSDANQETLRKEDPDLFASLMSNPDPYSQWAAAYKAIKRYGIYKEDVYVADKQRAQDNMSKPRPLNSVNPQQGNSPLTKVNAFSDGTLTQEDKDREWKEVLEATKRL